jgi:hypothetical protein
MSTEAWFRNPDLYIRELVEVGAHHLVWDRGYVHSKRIDPTRHAELHFPPHVDYRILMTGDQGTAELRRGHTMANPYAVYATWEYGQPWEVLEEIVASNVGLDPHACADTTVPIDERPVADQEHRVVIIRPPVATSGPGRKFFIDLRTLQQEYPSCIIHVHGVFSYRIAFGMQFGSADMESRLLAKGGKVALPTGRQMKYEQTMRCPQWVTLLGYNVSDLKVPRNRCMYNIKSAMWAAEHWDDLIKIKTKGQTKVDPTATHSLPATTSSVMATPKKAGEGDKYLCDTCSLADTCKYYRSGSVCAVPGSEPASLTKMFGSRSAETIVSGLGQVLAANAARMERGMVEEEAYGELDPEVTRIAALLIKGGKDLAKLLDPSLRAGPTTAIQINQGAGGATVSVSPQQVVANMVSELEARGIARADITPAMIEGLLQEMSAGKPASAAIEATVVAAGSDQP